MIVGDVNCDDEVNEVDAQAILEYTYTNGATPLPCPRLAIRIIGNISVRKKIKTSKYGKLLLNN